MNSAAQYNRGVELLSKDDMTGARHQFTEIVNDSSSSDMMQAYSFFNLAVIAQKKGERCIKKLRESKMKNRELVRECVLLLQLARDLYAHAGGFDVKLPLLSGNLGLLLQQDHEARRLGVVFSAESENPEEPEKSEKPEEPENPEKPEKSEKPEKPEKPESDRDNRSDLDDSERLEELMDAMINDEKEMRLKFKHERGRKRGGARVEQDW